MSYYTKARLWSNIASNINSISQATGDIVQMSRNIADMDTNRLLNDNFDDYKKIVDYTDAHIISAQNSDRESFIAAAASATGVDSKFIDNVFTTTNFDPAKMNGATLTDWMLQNGYGTESWRRDYVTKKLVELEENKIAEYIQTSLINDANEQLESNPSSLDNWSSFTGKKLNEYMNAEKIANALNMNVQRVKELMTSGNISERVNKWYETDFSDEMNNLQYQQQSANIATQTQSILDVHVLQCINNNASDTEFAQGVLNIINRTGYSAAFDKGMKDRMIASSIASYLSQYAVDFAKTNYMLSDAQFFSRYESDMTTKRDSIVKAFGDSGIIDDMISYADSAIYKALGTAYKIKNEKLEDSAEAYTKAQADKIKSDLEYASTEIKNMLTSADYNISNGLSYIYASMDIDTFVNDVSGGVFTSEKELLEWCNANNKSDIYKSFLELHSSAMSSYESEKQKEIDEYSSSIKLGDTKKADELIAKIKENPYMYVAWTDDDISRAIGFESYEAYMNDNDKNKRDLFNDIKSAIDSAKKTEQSQEDIALTIKTENIIMQINDAPSLYYDKDGDFAAKVVGFDSYYSYRNGNPTQHQVSCFNSIMGAIGSAGNAVSNEEAERKKATDEARKQFRSQYTTTMEDNSSAIIELAKSGLLYTPDRLAFILTIGKFKDSNDLLDNASPEIKTLYIETLSKMDDAYAEYTGININSVVESASKARNENLTGNVNVGYVSFSGYYADSINGTPDSYDKDKFQLFNDDSEPIADFTLKQSSVNVYNPFEETYEWIDNDYTLAKDNEVTSRIYDIDAFNSYVNRFYPDMKNNTKFMKTLIAQWNKAYCSIPTAEKVMEKNRDAVFSEAFEMALDGDLQGAQLLMAENKSYWKDDKTYADDLKKISITISDDVKSVVNYVENKVKGMLPKGSEYANNLYKYMNIDEATTTRLQAEITKNPSDRDKILSDFADSCFLNLQSDMIKEYYRELNAISAPTFRDYGKGTADYSGNAADLFARYVSGKPVVGSLDANTFSVLYNSLMSSNNVNALDMASEILFSENGNEVDFKNLSDFQKNMVYAAALPVVYLKDKSSYMVDRLKNVTGIKEGDLKIVTFNNDVAIVDKNSGILYTIPVNTESGKWVKYNVNTDVISSIGDSDFLYRIGFDDVGGINSGSAMQIGDLIISSRNSGILKGISENTTGDYLSLGDNPTAVNIKEEYNRWMSAFSNPDLKPKKSQRKYPWASIQQVK